MVQDVSRFQRTVAAFTLGGFVSTLGSSAFAYNRGTHQQIVETAWQSLRAVSDDQLTQHISWDAPPPSGLTLDDPRECATVGPTNHCGRGVSSTEWHAFLAQLRPALQRLNTFQADIPLIPLIPGCNEPSLSNTLGDFPDAVASNYNDLAKCDLLYDDSTDQAACRLFGGSPDNPGDLASCSKISDYRPAGIFQNVDNKDATGIRRLADDGPGRQGLALGWQAKLRDDDLADTGLSFMPVLIGQLLSALATVVETVLGAVFVPFVCLWDWIFGSDDDCVSGARKAANTVDLTNFIKGIIPGWDRDRSDRDTGLWHYINVRNGLSNWYDDQQGLFYEEAGPSGVAGVEDAAIALGGDIGFVTLDHDRSAGTDRYEIRDGFDNHPNSSHRFPWQWESETIGHVQFSPLDNLGYFGDVRLRQAILDGSRHLDGISWPLHALGDATVPHHLVGTSGHGHRPYEDFIEHDWAEIMFLECKNVVHKEGCNEDAQRLAQFLQVHRILQHAFKWSEQHLGIRNFVTALARETLSAAGDGLGSWPYCDSCSITNDFPFMTDIERTAVYAEANLRGINFRADDPVWYYRQHVGSIRSLVESSVGATVAYLVNSTAGVCSAVGETCAPFPCSTGTCTNHSCCRTDSQACNADAECCGGRCTSGSCCLAPNPTASCTADQDCCGGSCASGHCCLNSGTACTTEDCCAGFQCGSNSHTCEPIIVN